MSSLADELLADLDGLDDDEPQASGSGANGFDSDAEMGDGEDQGGGGLVLEGLFKYCIQTHALTRRDRRRETGRRAR
jgi:hypothetical protein